MYILTQIEIFLIYKHKKFCKLLCIFVDLRKQKFHKYLHEMNYIIPQNHELVSEEK